MIPQMNNMAKFANPLHCPASRNETWPQNPWADMIQSQNLDGESGGRTNLTSERTLQNLPEGGRAHQHADTT
jgi:hypothetical protein